MADRNSYREVLASAVNQHGGTAIVSSDERLPIGFRGPVTWDGAPIFPGERFEQVEVVLREATRDEWLAFPWPSHSEIHGPYYYEVGFD
jgi:hypothetical protein